MTKIMSEADSSKSHLLDSEPKKELQCKFSVKIYLTTIRSFGQMITGPEEVN